MALAAVTAIEVVRCRRCGRAIADWDGEHITVTFAARSGTPMFVEIPGGRAVIQCHHTVMDRGRRLPCGEVNRLALR